MFVSWLEGGHTSSTSWDSNRRPEHYSQTTSFPSPSLAIVSQTWGSAGHVCLLFLRQFTCKKDKEEYAYSHLEHDVCMWTSNKIILVLVQDYQRTEAISLGCHAGKLTHKNWFNILHAFTHYILCLDGYPESVYTLQLVTGEYRRLQRNTGDYYWRLLGNTRD